MITHETLKELGRVYRDIEAGEKLLAEVDEQLAKQEERVGFHGDIQSSFRCCQLGWPSSSDGYRLYNVEPRIARAVIVAHIADQRAKLEKLNEVARLEIEAVTP
ncbi:MAG: hypothetical protein PHS14_20945 [Elusimicrobia bacterium]|nr:hypothetical protein [Elusimicrobiota bacterium]